MLNYVLVVILTIELLIAYWMNQKDLLSPSVIFCGGFLIAALNLAGNIGYWDVNLSENTIWVICGGVFVFEMTAFLISSFYRGRYIGFQTDRSFESLREVSIESWKLNGCILVNAMILLIVWANIIFITKKFGVYSNPFSSIASYRTLSMEKNDISFSSIVNYCYLFCRGSGFIWLYILINNYLARHKLSFKVLINLCLSILSYLLSGGRGDAIFLILSGIPIFYYLWCRKCGSIVKLKWKYMIYIALIIMGIGIFYRSLGMMIGRDIKSSWYEHLSVNLGAPILNLDIYLQKKWERPPLWGYNTFGYLIKTLGRHLGISGWIYNLDMPFRYSKGHPLGNVYTIFYPFYYDFKYAGVYTLTVIMAAIMQVLYKKCRLSVLKLKDINIFVILFSKLLILIGFSFFSNKFFEEIITISFYEEIFIIWLLKIFLTKVKII